MARSRALHQRFFSSEHNQRLNDRQRLLFLGLISTANDQGKQRGNPAIVRATIFPYDEIPLMDIENDLRVLDKEGLIACYQIGDSHYIKICKWDSYQRVEHPGKDDCPNPSIQATPSSNIIDGRVHSGSFPEDFGKPSRNSHETLMKNERGALVEEKLREEKEVSAATIVTEGAAQSNGSPENLSPPENPTSSPEIANAIFTFPTNGSVKSWDLTLERIITMRDLYPGVDVDLETRKALQWTIDNPSRRKTVKGMPRFISSWLERAQNKSAGTKSRADKGSATWPTE